MIHRGFSGWLLLLLTAFAAAAAEPAADDHLRRTAEAGDADAAVRLGSDYFNGNNGRQRNLTAAAYWFRRAAQQKHSEGHYRFAFCLDHGYGVSRDRATAFEEYSRAAAAGITDAAVRRAEILFDGLAPGFDPGSPGITADPAAAGAILRECAAQDHPVAMRLLAVFALRQPAGKRDDAQIETRLRRAAELGDTPAKRILGERLLASADRRERQRGADLLTAAGDAGDAAALTRLGIVREQGLAEAPPDEEAAFACFRRAAEMGDAAARIHLAGYMWRGSVVRQNIPEAIKLYRAGAAAGHPLAQYMLGQAMLKGIGTEPDAAGGAEWLQRAAANGEIEAQLLLASLYENGRHLPSDPAAAVYWYRRAAELGSRDGMREFGLRLLRGRGITADPAAARAILRRAAGMGDAVSADLLKNL